MGKTGPRPIEYVCCSLIDGSLVSRAIVAKSSNEAIRKFETEFKAQPDVIHGPYHRKRSGALDNTRNVEFSGICKKMIYRDWIVTASILKSPKNSAYLLFNSRVDGKKAQKPIGTYIIRLEDLKDYNG